MKSMNWLGRLWMVILSLGMLAQIAGAAGLDELRQALKDCDSPECRARIQAEAETLFDRAGNNFNDDFAGMGNTITVNHCRSLITEIFYHLGTLKPYYNFKDVFYLEKLKKIKALRHRLDAGEISESDFRRLVHQTELQYQNDTAESQAFIDTKVARIKELVENLHQNVEAIKATERVKEKPLAPHLRQSILALRNDPIWQEFSHHTREGRKIIETLNSASANASQGLIPGLQGLFAGFEENLDMAIFPAALVDRLAQAHPIR